MQEKRLILCEFPIGNEYTDVSACGIGTYDKFHFIEGTPVGTEAVEEAILEVFLSLNRCRQEHVLARLVEVMLKDEMAVSAES